MKGQLLALVLFVLVPMAATQGQEPPERYPGQRHHARPPEGWTCSPDAKDKEHECHCRRMVGPDDPLCETEPDPRECSVHCWAKAQWIPDERDPTKGHYVSSHCECPILNSDGSALCGHGK